VRDEGTTATLIRSHQVPVPMQVVITGRDGTMYHVKPTDAELAKPENANLRDYFGWASKRGHHVLTATESDLEPTPG